MKAVRPIEVLRRKSKVSRVSSFCAGRIRYTSKIATQKKQARKINLSNPDNGVGQKVKRFKILFFSEVQ